jgi:Chain length determinant protein
VTLKLDQPMQSFSDIGSKHADQTVVLSGRFVSLRFLGAALRRSKRVWIAFAILGLLVGGGYHLVVPRKYSAYSTVYMAHGVGANDAVEIGNDLALLNNTAVARAAIRSLHEPSLNPDTFLGKAPGVSISDNVIDITMQGPTYQEAVRRVNAVTAAFLKFRAEQYTAQDNAIVKGLNEEIASLQKQSNSLTNTINSADTSTSQLTQLVAERASIQSEISNLQQDAQTDQVDTDSIVQASRVLTSGTEEYHSTVRLLLIDALSGLAAGLVIGLGVVALRALTSDRVRRREDLAMIVGANVEVSTGHRKARHGGSRAAPTSNGKGHLGAQTGIDTSSQLAPVASYFEHLITSGTRRHVLAVAVDDVNAPAEAIVAAATSLAAQLKKVVLVDLTADRVLESRFKRLLKRTDGAVQQIEIAPKLPVTLYIAPRDLGPEDDQAAWELGAERWEDFDAVLALATIDFGRGAWHLRTWDQAILTVTAGRSTPQRIGGTAELLRTTGVSVSAAILFNADADDESVGLVPVPGLWNRAQLSEFGAVPPIRR